MWAHAALQRWMAWSLLSSIIPTGDASRIVSSSALAIRSSAVRSFTFVSSSFRV
jgi:hypothetical protein